MTKQGVSVPGYCGKDEEVSETSGIGSFQSVTFGKYVLCACSDREDVQTGCDVEMKGKLRMPVAERYFCREECEIIRNGKDEKEQAEWFYRFWVLKESFMKATRRGMGLDMRTYEFAWGQDGIPYLKSSLRNIRRNICAGSTNWSRGTQGSR